MKGLMIQEPYATLIARGIKKVETRKYAPPPELVGRRIALIATDGKWSSVVGTALLRGWMDYDNERQFRRDYLNHLVPKGSKWDWKKGDKRRCGWFMSEPTVFKEFVPAPSKRGRVWTSDVEIPKTPKEDWNWIRMW